MRMAPAMQVLERLSRWKDLKWDDQADSHATKEKDA